MRQPHGGQESQKSASPPSWTVSMAARSKTVRRGPLAARPRGPGSPGHAWACGLPGVSPRPLQTSTGTQSSQFPQERLGWLDLQLKDSQQGQQVEGRYKEGRSRLSGAISKQGQVWPRCEWVCGCDPRPCVLGQHGTVYMPHHLHLGLCVCVRGGGPCICDKTWVLVSKTL